MKNIKFEIHYPLFTRYFELLRCNTHLDCYKTVNLVVKEKE